jgi:predicted transcriptional regulator with HTH domain
MTADTENMILELLRRIRSEVSDVKDRLTGIEMRMSGMEDHMRGTFTQIVSLQHEATKAGKDVATIKQRLDLVDAE